MQTGFYSTAGAMVAQFNKLDNATNNLANLNTDGFKRKQLIVGDFTRLYKEMRDKLPIEGNTKDAAKFLHRTMARVPQIVDSFNDFTIGPLRNTENTFDLALTQKDLFFAIETPNGVRLTRNGSFTLNEEGLLTTKDGFKVIPADYLKKPQGISVGSESKVTIGRDGTFYVDEIPTKQLMLVQPKNLRMLQKEGDNLFSFDTTDMLNPIKGSSAVRQGFIEKSNVNPVTQMVSLIEVNRLAGMYQQVMKTHMDDLNSEAINKLAYTKA